MKKDLINLAQRAAKAAGAEILRYYHEGNFEVSTKEDNSPLTNADIAANDAIYFWNPDISTCNWINTLNPHLRIGNHVFAR